MIGRKKPYFCVLQFNECTHALTWYWMPISAMPLHSVLQEFQRLVADSRRPMDAATEKAMKQMRRKVARRRWKRAISAVRMIVRLGSNSKINSLLKDLPLHTPLKGLGSEQAARNQQVLRNEFHDNRFIKNVDSSKSSSFDSSTARKIARGSLEKPSYFRDGSLMKNLVESGALYCRVLLSGKPLVHALIRSLFHVSGIEVAFISDRHPNDVVYSICCNRREKRVSVVFRGTVRPAARCLLNFAPSAGLAP